eukprot:TRINITY_DN1464_c0_g1_i1.p1 TRINITY_DN1464_c0_g1~~TRINITY_DN1464_c0_g1_i1.p1  ORF type:complete len:120 (-),score=28.86 TRINITY_DN1464_c0_g1_i1:82-441(-)
MKGSFVVIVLVAVVCFLAVVSAKSPQKMSCLLCNFTTQQIARQYNEGDSQEELEKVIDRLCGSATRSAFCTQIEEFGASNFVKYVQDHKENPESACLNALNMCTADGTAKTVKSIKGKQ